MIAGVVDTTVIIHLFRRNQQAIGWLASNTERLAITPFTWLEVIYGAPGKSGQVACQQLLDQFAMVYLTDTDMDWAMERLLARRLSHGVAIMDCLIASVCHRLQVPLYTHNRRDMEAILGQQLTVTPY